MSDTAFSPALPERVAFVALGPESEPDPLLPEEEALLPPRAVETRRRDFRMGRTAAHRALAALGVGPAAILRGPDREPLWPDGVVGSITHAAGHAMAAVARQVECAGIGIDLEHRDRYFPDLVKHIAFGEERIRLDGLRSDERSGATMELFAAKESIYKAFFPRVARFFGFDAAEVVTAARPGWLEGRLLVALDPAYPPHRRFPIEVQWRRDLVLTTIVLAPDAERRPS